jgi:diacylglycerol kinase (ATP)
VSQPTDPVALIVNPTAGKGAGRRLGELTRAALVAQGHRVLDVSGPDYASARERAARAVADGVPTLVVVGGDGMAHLGTNLVATTPTRLLVVAGGTGNDVATNLGLPVNDPAAAVALLEHGTTRAVDAGRVRNGELGDRWFAGVLGAGFDAVVNARAQRMRWPRGQMRYNLAILRELPVFHAIPYAVELDGQRIETRAMLVTVANTTSFGGGMRVSPDADMADGLFDVMIVHELSIPAFLRVFPRVFSGTHVGHPAVETHRAARVRLEADGIRSQADGEPFTDLPIDAEVVPGALRVVVPVPAGTRIEKEVGS